MRAKAAHPAIAGGARAHDQHDRHDGERGDDAPERDLAAQPAPVDEIIRRHVRLIRHGRPAR